MKRILLFDLDGVLILPRGYRAAVHDTLTYFLDDLNLSHLEVDDGLPPLFESLGVTSEWDMIAVSLAVALDAAAGAFPHLAQAGTLVQIKIAMENLDLRELQVDWRGRVRALGPFMKREPSPSEALLAACRGNGHQLLPNLSGQEILDDLLGCTRALCSCPTTRFFQNLALGAEMFREYYDQEPFLEAPSYLLAMDEPLAAPETSTRILAGMRSGEHFAAALTARPSLPPRGVTNEPREEYSPEAELALKAVGLSELPSVAWGRLVYQGKKLGKSPDLLLKPAPTQALAGMAAALTGDEVRALDWAAEMMASPTPAETARQMLPESLEVHVFEDSPVGILAVQRAAALLALAGVEVQVRAWGIASGHHEKTEALRALGAEICEDVNQAVAQVLG